MIKTLSWSFRKYVCTTDILEIMDNLLNKWDNLSTSYVINGNEASKYYQVYTNCGEHTENNSVLITR